MSARTNETANRIACSALCTAAVLDVGAQTVAETKAERGLALTGMVDDGEVSRVRALELARLVMRENAVSFTVSSQ